VQAVEKLIDAFEREVKPAKGIIIAGDNHLQRVDYTRAVFSAKRSAICCNYRKRNDTGRKFWRMQTGFRAYFLLGACCGQAERGLKESHPEFINRNTCLRQVRDPASGGIKAMITNQDLSELLKASSRLSRALRLRSGFLHQFSVYTQSEQNSVRIVKRIEIDAQDFPVFEKSSPVPTSPQCKV